MGARGRRLPQPQRDCEARHRLALERAPVLRIDEEGGVIATRKSITASSVRIAIYTRVSVAEGLEKEFNSIDAQREACAAYVASQRGAGWVAIPEQYDDGGYTGANTDR